MNGSNGYPPVYTDEEETEFRVNGYWTITGGKWRFVSPELTAAEAFAVGFVGMTPAEARASYQAQCGTEPDDGALRFDPRTRTATVMYGNEVVTVG